MKGYKGSIHRVDPELVFNLINFNAVADCFVY
jgi:hypothetical protein